MRLINTTTLQLEEFFDKAVHKYAILSHTWGQNEVIFADYEQRIHGEQNLEDTEDEAVSKIRGFCRLAAEGGHTHGWVDTCCIDKKSSAELSEAINSMHQWYRDTGMCYIYLNDVSKQVSWHATAEEIRLARWFTRGWTLQELLAPCRYKFYDRHWEILGGRDGSRKRCLNRRPLFQTPWHIKGDLAFPDLLSNITGINVKILVGEEDPEDRSVAEKMSWASDRVTSRKEDVAYCLLGIFGVNMPLLYGEGDRAFARLQAAIMEVTDDHTILAWDYGIASTHTRRDNLGCLARSPSDFRHGSLLKTPQISRQKKSIAQHHTLTHLGLQITLPVLKLPHMGDEGYLAALSCIDGSEAHMTGKEDSTHAVVIPLFRSFPYSNRFHRPEFQTRPIAVDKKTFENAPYQSMYLEIGGPRASDHSLHDMFGDKMECRAVKAGSTEFAITERFPHHIKSRVGNDESTPVSTCSHSITVAISGLAPFGEQSINCMLIAALKFITLPTQSTAIREQDSYFVLVRYSMNPANDTAVVKDYGLMSGYGRWSLADFMLDAKAVADFFQSPTRKVRLCSEGTERQAGYLHCRQLKGKMNRRGNKMFKFQLEVSSSELPPRPQLLG